MVVAYGQPSAVRSLAGYPLSCPREEGERPMMTDGATWARMVAEHARSSRRAVVSPEGVWTFRELTERAEGWAAWLDAADFRPGGPLPILIGSTPQAYAVLL